jgi:hypothetical protein
MSQRSSECKLMSIPSLDPLPVPYIASRLLDSVGENVRRTTNLVHGDDLRLVRLPPQDLPVCGCKSSY